jgi:hypothetical protein
MQVVEIRVAALNLGATMSGMPEFLDRHVPIPSALKLSVMALGRSSYGPSSTAPMWPSYSAENLTAAPEGSEVPGSKDHILAEAERDV